MHCWIWIPLISSCFSGKVFEKKKIAAELFDLMSCKMHRNSINKSSFLQLQTIALWQPSKPRSTSTNNQHVFVLYHEQTREIIWNFSLEEVASPMLENGEGNSRWSDCSFSARYSLKVVSIQLRLKVFQWEPWVWRWLYL